MLTGQRRENEPRSFPTQEQYTQMLDTAALAAKGFADSLAAEREADQKYIEFIRQISEVVKSFLTAEILNGVEKIDSSIVTTRLAEALTAAFQQTPQVTVTHDNVCLLYTSPSPRD